MPELSFDEEVYVKVSIRKGTPGFNQQFAMSICEGMSRTNDDNGVCFFDRMSPWKAKEMVNILVGIQGIRIQVY